MAYAGMGTRKLMLRYVVPQMIGLVFNSVYFIVDGVFIGRVLGSRALAAAGVAVPAVELTIAISMMLAAGSGVLISARAGAGDAKGARHVFNTAVCFTLVFSLALAVAGVLLAGPLARLLGAGSALMADTVAYLRPFMAFSPFLIFSYALSGWVRNDGAPRLAMWALTVGALSNILLDWVFMVPLGMGIGGAALATGLGPVFSVLILLPHFLRRRGSLHFKKTRLCAKAVGGILLAGAPSFAAEFSIGFLTLLYNRAIMRNGLGEDGLASYMVIGYAALICITAFLGAAQGVQPPVSYYHGAGQPAQIRKLFRAVSLFCLALALGLWLALFAGGRFFYGIFLEDAALVRQTAQASAWYFTMLPAAALNILIISFLQSAGRVWPSMAVSLARSTLPPAVLLWVLPLLLGAGGLWLAAAAAELVALVLGAVLWHKYGPAKSRASKAEEKAHPAAASANSHASYV